MDPAFASNGINPKFWGPAGWALLYDAMSVNKSVDLKQDVLSLLKDVLPCKSCRKHAQQYSKIYNPNMMVSKRQFLANLDRMRKFVNTQRQKDHPNEAIVGNTDRPTTTPIPRNSGFSSHVVFLASLWANIPLQDTISQRLLQTSRFTADSLVLTKPGKGHTLRALLHLMNGPKNGFSRDNAFNTVVKGIVKDFHGEREEAVQELRKMIERHRVQSCSFFRTDWLLSR